MAKIYKAPEEFQPPVLDYKRYDAPKARKAEDAYLKRLSAWCKERYAGELVGKILQVSIDDGYAIYMVMRQKPFCLIHIQLGNSWRADEIWERGITLADARKRLA